MNHKFQIFFILLILSYSCSVSPDEPTTPIFDPPQIFVSDSRVFESDGGSLMLFEIGIPRGAEQLISFNFEVEGITATPDVDFIAGTGSGVIGVGSQVAVVEVRIINDDINEVDEEISLTLTAVENGIIQKGQGIGVIQDSDPTTSFNEEGYITASEFYGYQLAWSDEFDSNTLSTENYNFDLGDGCPDLCTWGNGELQWYTDETKNIKLENGKLVFTATKAGAANYNSARINTKGKREFQFGRIDIRARLPKGQGIWPAIWMLGSNIDEVSWPASGEIDIMEMVGHEPKTVHGTAHWGPQGRGFSTFKGGKFSLNENFNEKFHVFSIVWQPNKIVWYVDETKFFTITPSDMNGEQYRFNHAFYLLINVAIGGNFPGNPDETTEFPQSMEIDYIRVFQ